MKTLVANELIFEMSKLSLAIVNNYGESFNMHIEFGEGKKVKYSYSKLKTHPQFLVSEPRAEDYVNRIVEMNLYSRKINDFLHSLFKINVFDWNEEPGEDCSAINFYSILSMKVPNMSLIEKKFNFTYCVNWDFLLTIVEDLMDDDIRSLKELVTVIEYYYPNKLKNKKIVCPFHNDKNPSFYMKENNSAHSFYKCFGCGESGDITTFTRKVENLNFILALKKAYEILGKDLSLPTRKDTFKRNNPNPNHPRYNNLHNNNSDYNQHNNSRDNDSQYDNSNYNHNNVENSNNIAFSKAKTITNNQQATINYYNYKI